MIYLENITSGQDVMIPSNGRACVLTVMGFELKSTISGEVVYDGSLMMQAVGGYFCAVVSLPAGIQSGEYAFRLYKDSEVYASGLCQIGEYSRPIQQGDGGFVLKQAK